MATASDVLRIARGEVGYCRYDDPERGTKYGRWYESEVDGPGGYDYGANGVAYCAMFASWVLAQAGVECAGMPGAYCPSIHHSQTLAASQLQPGDLVLFDWDNDNTDDHIG
ncbi:MAG: CHAP domain-containing protein, partial [Adlercreutzia sp.]|nr:CHAP domain-containing protein [Adlercreutzia sp.]